MPGSASGSTVGARPPGTSVAISSTASDRCVQHQIARLARLDDAAQHRRELLRGLVRLLCRDEHRLRAEEHAERAQAVRSQRVATRDEVDDRVGEAETRGELHGARYVDEVGVHAVLGEQRAREDRVDGGNAPAVEVGELPRRCLVRHGRLQRARAEAEPEQLRDPRPALEHEVGAGDAARDGAVLHVLGDVRGSHEQHLDGRIATRERERALPGLLGAEPGRLEQRDGRLAQATLRRDRNSQRVRERRRARSSASR